jgi:hypothetical protein
MREVILASESHFGFAESVSILADRDPRPAWRTAAFEFMLVKCPSQAAGPALSPGPAGGPIMITVVPLKPKAGLGPAP